MKLVQPVRISILLVCLLALLAGCTPAPADTAPPTPAALRVVITPALRPLAEILRRCAAGKPISLAVEELPANALELQPNELVFRLGQPAEARGYAVQIGWETLGVIVHADNPTTKLSADELAALFSGGISTWAEGGQAVQVWAYPPGDEARQAFDAAVLGQKSLTGSARLAPDPQAMLDSVAHDPAALGYLPLKWFSSAATPVPPTVKLIRLETKLGESLRQPVLAFSLAEAEGNSRALLLCVQESWSQP